jgi:hypothetical protein
VALDGDYIAGAVDVERERWRGGFSGHWGFLEKMRGMESRYWGILSQGSWEWNDGNARRALF